MFHRDSERLQCLYDIIDDLRVKYAALLKENKELRKENQKLKKAVEQL